MPPLVQTHENEVVPGAQRAGLAHLLGEILSSQDAMFITLYPPLN